MNAPKVSELDYINFLVATPKVVSCTGAARVQPEGRRRAAHDALTRLLQRLEPDPLPLWREAEPLVERDRGLLVVDDTTLDKPYAREIALVHRHWSGKHRRVVAGINLVTLVWSDDTHAVPCDYRLFDAPNDRLTKNDHFRAMLQSACERGFSPRYVCRDDPSAGAADHGYDSARPLRLEHRINGLRVARRGVAHVVGLVGGAEAQQVGRDQGVARREGGDHRPPEVGRAAQPVEQQHRVFLTSSTTRSSVAAKVRSGGAVRLRPRDISDDHCR